MIAVENHDALIEELRRVQTPGQLEVWRKSNRVTSELIRDLVSRVADMLEVDARSGLKLAETTATLALTLGDPDSSARAFRARGAALFLCGQHVDSIEDFDRALRLFQDSRDELEAAKTVANRIPPLFALSRFEDALAGAEEAREYYERAGHTELLSTHLINIGQIYFRLDRFEENLECLDRAEAILLEIGDRRNLCYAHMNRAVALTSLNRFDEAARYYGMANELALECDMPALAAQSDYNICYLYFRRGEYTTALERLVEARRRMNDSGDQWHSALCDMDQAEIYLVLNMHSDAVELGQQAYAAFEKLGMRYEMAKSATYTALARYHLNQFDRALELLQRAGRIFQEDNNRVWMALTDLYQGTVLFQLGRFFESRSLARRAHAFFAETRLRTKALYARLLLARSKLALGEVEDARHDTWEIGPEFEASTLPWLGYQYHSLVGDICVKTADIHGAREAYRLAVGELDVLRTHFHFDEMRMTVLADKMHPYECLAALEIQHGGADAAEVVFHLAERAKSRTLVDMLANTIHAIRPDDHCDDALVDRLRRTRQEVVWHDSVLNVRDGGGGPAQGDKASAREAEEVRRREKQLVELIGQASGPGLGYPSLQRATAVSLDTVRSALPPGCGLIEYCFINDALLAFVVTQRGLETFRLTTRQRVQVAFERFRFQMTKLTLGAPLAGQAMHSNREEVGAALGTLYDDLIRPIERAIARLDALVIVPHSFLHYLPFHALTSGGQALVEKFRISYAPSANALTACMALGGAAGPRPALLVGVADPKRPFVREEIRTLGDIVDGETLIGKDSTLEKLRQKAASAGLIHISTRANFRRDNALFSSIELRDTSLSLLEAFNLRIHCDLVVLNGCAPRLDAVVEGDGEEMLCLVRSFHYAGSPSLVTALWNVSEPEINLALLEGFYRHLKSGHGRAESLRMSMLDLKRSHPHPYHWAPFVLTGNPV